MRARSKSDSPLSFGPVLRSTTIYAFDLDDRQLRIEDIDLVQFQEDTVLSVPDRRWHPVKLKTINKRACSPEVAQFRLAPPPRDMEEALGRSRLDERARVRVEAGAVILEVEGKIQLSPSECPMLRLVYTVPLDGDGTQLFWVASVQPSDYVAVRRLFDLEAARKTIKMVAWSAERPFSTWTFRGSEPVPLPEPIPSTADPRGVHRFETELTIKMPPWDRASYLAIFSGFTRW